jgi:proteasome lid subunit RPN8/RPN11
MPRGRYSSLIELLTDDGRTFRERMADVEPETVGSILGAKKERPKPRRFAEHYFTMVGKRDPDGAIYATLIDNQTQDNPVLVEFDWEAVWRRHLEHRDVLGWFHTHPPGCHTMSGTDKDTFTSWLVALGGPRYAVILCEGQVHAWKLHLEGIELKYQPLGAEILADGRILIGDPA